MQIPLAVKWHSVLLGSTTWKIVHGFLQSWATVSDELVERTKPHILDGVSTAWNEEASEKKKTDYIPLFNNTASLDIDKKSM